jgi:putative component of toxin-antitoxin plasmid stabilization module
MKEFLDTKHIIKMKMHVYGRVDQSDIIGAIFGQTEDVLGEALDLRELQRKNKIGRIEVELETKTDKVVATVTIPSGLDRTESVIIAAALETIKKIGPCRAETMVDSIENIKRIKMRQIIEKAKEVLQRFMSVSIDSQELVDKVVEEVRKSQMLEYGKDKLPAGPLIETDDEIILVETKEDLLNLLSQGIKNCIAVENKYDSETIRSISSKKVLTALINRGREFIVRKIIETADIDYVTKPEFGKTVREMQSKEIYKAIRGRVSTEQIMQKPKSGQKRETAETRVQRPAVKAQTTYTVKGMDVFRKKFDELKDSKDACIIDKNLDVLGQVPVSDLASTISGLGSKIYAIVMHQKIPKDVVFKSERNRVNIIVASGTEQSSSRVKIIVLK